MDFLYKLIIQCSIFFGVIWFSKERLQMAMKDSYDLFLKSFGISKDDFYEFGLKNTIFIDHDTAKHEWERLKNRIEKGGKVFIRGYGQNGKGTSDLKAFYSDLLGNQIIIEEDPNRNSRPQRIVETLTMEKRNSTVFNYQVSHIWGHTKNPYMFEAPWNICFTPKMYDPFTGHETVGCWPQEYQELFLVQAFEKYKDIIEDYNRIVENLDLNNKLCAFLAKKVSWDDKKKKQFKKDVESQFSQIKLT